MGNIENIIYPNHPEVKVGTETDWVYIMRKDAVFAMTALSRTLAQSSRLAEQAILTNLLSGYNLFCDNLFKSLIEVFSAKGRAVLHLYEAEELEDKTRKLTNGKTIVSLDPLLDINQFKVSRGYYLGGMVDHGQINRPGSAHLDTQASELATKLSPAHLTVVEDDVFSGESLISALIHLAHHGLQIDEVVPGIQVGLPQKVTDQGIRVTPVVKYLADGPFNLFDKVDLGDPRDFLLGISGLVVKSPTSQYGRLPYILPFVSPTARASLPFKYEKQFSLNTLKMAIDFYSSVQFSLGIEIAMNQVDQHFSIIMQELFGFSPLTSMLDIANWAKENLDEIWEFTQAKGKQQYAKN